MVRHHSDQLSRETIYPDQLGLDRADDKARAVLVIAAIVARRGVRGIRRALENQSPRALRKALVRLLPRQIRAVYDEIQDWIERDGFCYPTRQYVAEAVGCCTRTVTRARALCQALGLWRIERCRRQDRKTGRWSEQASIWRAAAGPPDIDVDELDRVDTVVQQTTRLKKLLLKKVASGSSSNAKRASAARGGGFVSGQTILEEWAKRGLTPQCAGQERPPEGGS